MYWNSICYFPTLFTQYRLINFARLSTFCAQNDADIYVLKRPFLSATVNSSTVIRNINVCRSESCTQYSYAIVLKYTAYEKDNCTRFVTYYCVYIQQAGLVLKEESHTTSLCLQYLFFKPGQKIFHNIFFQIK